MSVRLNFTVKNNSERKEFSWPITNSDDISGGFYEALKELFPDAALPGSVQISFKEKDSRIEFHSSKQLNINGVSRKNHLLKNDDIIAVGPLRISYKSAETPAPLPRERARSPVIFSDIFLRPLPVSLTAALAAALIVAGCMTTKNTEVAETVKKKTEVLQVFPEESTQKTQIPAESAETVKEQREEQPVAQAPAAEKAADEEDSRPEILIVKPGETIPVFDLDILFIHSHPDDEALDFGCMMALADSAGLKTGLVTFTDGESGLDTYPDRPSTGIYPDRLLTGVDLAAVRVEELSQSAVILGVDLLVRSGFRNNPYNSIKDELTPDEVLEQWGGKTSLKKYLHEIIKKTTPETIISPEKPGKAREHFEHEAAGLLVHEIMDELSRGDSAQINHLTSVDPRQEYLYPEQKVIFANYKTGNLRLRDIQLKALAAHKTQNDSINIGRDFVKHYEYEYYVLQHWLLDEPWDQWIHNLQNAGTNASLTQN